MVRAIQVDKNFDMAVEKEAKRLTSTCQMTTFSNAWLI